MYISEHRKTPITFVPCIKGQNSIGFCSSDSNYTINKYNQANFEVSSIDKKSEWNDSVTFMKNSDKFINTEIEKEKIFKVNRFKIKNYWTKKEDQLLKKMTLKMGPKNWNYIAKFFDNKSAVQCSARYRRILIGHKKGPWTLKEDKLLQKLVAANGKNWAKISKLMINRSGKQIRERYINNLDPTINHEEFSFEEDKKIYNLYKIFGNRWSSISKYFVNRTGDMVKNRFHSFIRKRHIFYNFQNENIYSDIENANNNGKSSLKYPFSTTENVVSPEKKTENDLFSLDRELEINRLTNDNKLLNFSLKNADNEAIQKSNLIILKRKNFNESTHEIEKIVIKQALQNDNKNINFNINNQDLLNQSQYDNEINIFDKNESSIPFDKSDTNIMVYQGFNSQQNSKNLVFSKQNKQQNSLNKFKDISMKLCWADKSLIKNEFFESIAKEHLSSLISELFVEAILSDVNSSMNFLFSLREKYQNN